MSKIGIAQSRLDSTVAACLRVRQYVPGAIVCIVVALAAAFIAEHHGGPQLLYALLIGSAFNFLISDTRVHPGLNLCAKPVLRVGVALLGAKITVAQIAGLTPFVPALILASVVLTVLLGLGLAKLFQRPMEEGLLSGCAVGICGASAALTIAAVLPPTRENERFTLLVVVGVTIFSTLAMIVYPLLLSVLQFSQTEAGIILGGTIHDVAQVIASAMMIGPETTDTATVVKLFRVALLAPIALVVATLAYRVKSDSLETINRPPLLPWFLAVFLVLVGLASAGLLDPGLIASATMVSKWALLIAIAAAGIKTNFADLLRIGMVPVLMLLCETLFIALFVVISIRLVSIF
jgi:uncharacterized integral membrane protein (TIGR00698 family)